ncbi:hypothetical protein B0O99DRAFT_107893 [Bisporella sp. PMI_857]|nr:hypothetical protein B0O99DRAFT_107893 [Bisporella sp. PMI_857]
MKPISPKNALAHIVDHKPLMMLNSGLLGTRYIMQLVALTNTNITTTGGTSLPTELWNKILGFALVDAQNSFCFVQGISLWESSIGKILHCRRINLEGGLLCGNLDCAEAVYVFEEFINKPNQRASPPFTMPTLQPCQGYGNTFDIPTTSADDNLPVDSACLFSNVTVPDVISRMEGGACSFCFGSRLFCPGCTGGRAQEFDVFMGCGVELACPLCIGIDFSLEHRAFLRTYYWDDPPEEKQKSIDDWLRQRMGELGY